ncbi:MAG: TatD family hydrolase [Minisyncoccia bacterium]|jgi:TatD DNase family protein
MDLKFFDAHCHVQLPQFDTDRENVLARMEDDHVGAVIIGTDFATSRGALLLAEQYGFLWAAVGLHPNDNIEEELDIVSYKKLAADRKVVAIGECGLDYSHSGITEKRHDAQKKRFAAQITLALEVHKPLMIHCRNSEQRIANEKSAHDDIFAMLREYTSIHPELKVIIHFFTGTVELAKQYLELGCYLSFPGPITYTDMYDESIKATPLDKILSETDSPFAAPVPYRGKRNEPAYVEEVVKKLAAIKEVSVDNMAAHIGENFKKVFKV